MANLGVKRSRNGEPKYSTEPPNYITIDDSDDERQPTLEDFLPAKPSNNHLRTVHSGPTPRPNVPSVSASSATSQRYVTKPSTAVSTNRSTAPSVSTSAFKTAVLSSTSPVSNHASSKSRTPATNIKDGSDRSRQHEGIASIFKPFSRAVGSLTSKETEELLNKFTQTHASSQRQASSVQPKRPALSNTGPSSEKTSTKSNNAIVFGTTQTKPKVTSFIDLSEDSPRLVAKDELKHPNSILHLKQRALPSRSPEISGTSASTPNRPRRPHELLSQVLNQPAAQSKAIGKPLGERVDISSDDDDDAPVTLDSLRKLPQQAPPKSSKVPAAVPRAALGRPRKADPPRTTSSEFVSGKSHKQRQRTPADWSIPIRQSQQPPTPQKVSVVIDYSKSFARPWITRGRDFIDQREPSHGMCAIYSTESDQHRMQKLAQPKAKDVDRSQVKLDFGPSFSPAGGLKSTSRPTKPSLLLRQMDQLRLPKRLTFVNEFNSKRLPGRFQLVKENIVHSDIRPAPKESMFGCTCVEECNPKTCECLLDDDGTDANHPAKLVPYLRKPDGSVVLTPEYIDREVGYQIQECNELCGCTPSCWNRLVQKGRTIRLEIFMTERCGLGLRSPLPIAKGQFIDTYVGELLTNRTLIRREKLRRKAYGPHHPSYVFSLDYFKEHELKGKPVYHIDGERFGGPTRFINHSCDPNCRIFSVMIHNADYKVYSLAFFAIRDIKAYEELCFDYSPDEVGLDEHEDPESHGAVPCYCGAKNCKRVLWGGSKAS